MTHVWAKCPALLILQEGIFPQLTFSFSLDDLGVVEAFSTETTVFWTFFLTVIWINSLTEKRLYPSIGV